MAEERGLSKEQAALLISLIGAFNTAGRVISGQYIALIAEPDPEYPPPGSGSINFELRIRILTIYQRFEEAQYFIILNDLQPAGSS